MCWRRDRPPTPVFWGFPCGSAGKETTCNVRDLGLIPGLGEILWRRERLHTPVFWPREFHGLAESDTTERLSLSHASYLTQDKGQFPCLQNTDFRSRQFGGLLNTWCVSHVRWTTSSFSSCSSFHSGCYSVNKSGDTSMIVCVCVCENRLNFNYYQHHTCIWPRTNHIRRRKKWWKYLITF